LVDELEPVALELAVAVELVPRGQTQVQVVSRALRSKALVIPSMEAPMRTAFVKCMIAMWEGEYFEWIEYERKKDDK
jgi:hypothetical protein